MTKVESSKWRSSYFILQRFSKCAAWLTGGLVSYLNVVSIWLLYLTRSNSGPKKWDIHPKRSKIFRNSEYLRISSHWLAQDESGTYWYELSCRSVSYRSIVSCSLFWISTISSKNVYVSRSAATLVYALKNI